MLPKNNERYKPKHKNQKLSLPKSLEDFERHLLQEIKEVEEILTNTNSTINRKYYEAYRQRFYRLSNVHHELRAYQLSQ